MHNPEVDQVPAALERRTFLTQLCASGLLCVGCSRAATTCEPTAALAAVRRLHASRTADSKMTFERVYDRYDLKSDEGSRLAARSSCRAAGGRAGWRPIAERATPPEDRSRRCHRLA